MLGKISCIPSITRERKREGRNLIPMRKAHEAEEKVDI